MANKSTQKRFWIFRVIVVAVLFSVALAEKNSTASDKALAMPETELAVVDAGYTEVRADWFTVKQPAFYAFEPSTETRLLAARHITFDGALPRMWYSYAPKRENEMPLVILLHGAGRDGLSLIEMWKGIALRRGIALVAPNSVGGTWSLDDPAPQFIVDIVAEMSSQYQIDADRIFLFGHSDGAAYAQILLNRAQGPWRAAALHAGYAPSSRLRPAQLAKPIRMYFGENEEIFDLGQARDIGRWFAHQGSRSELLVIPGHNHWLYEVGPQIAEDAWGWFSMMTN